MLALILLILAFVLSLLAAFGVGGKVSLFPLAFACYTASLLVGRIPW
jgi:hypothetical protein